MRISGKTISPYSIAMVLVLFIWVILLAYFIHSNQQSTDDDFVVQSSAITYNDIRYVKNPALQTVLVMGLDTLDVLESSESYNNDYLSDFLALMIFDDQAETYKILTINRDTITDIPVLDISGEFIGYKDGQIALAYSYGDGLDSSAQNSVDAVSSLLMDININRYITLGMSAIPIINDAVGGVTLEILADYSSVDPEMQEGVTLTLTGEQALTYIRNRVSLDDSSNLYRMERQSQYINAMYEQMYDTVNSGSMSLSILNDIEDYLVTDCTTNDFSDIIDKCGEYEFLGFVTLDGDAQVYDVYMEYHLYEESLMETVLELFYIVAE